jgi:hypothetical protein
MANQRSRGRFHDFLPRRIGFAAFSAKYALIPIKTWW